MGDVTSPNNLLALGLANIGSENSVKGQGPLRPFQPKLIFSRLGEKSRMKESKTRKWSFPGREPPKSHASMVMDSLRTWRQRRAAEGVQPKPGRWRK